LASSALAGTLFLSGYYSKDYIIDTCGLDTFIGNFIYFLCFVTIAITAIYTMGDDDDADEDYDYDSYKLYTKADRSTLNEEFVEGQKQFYVDSQDCGPLSTLATGILLSLSFFLGIIFFDYLVGIGSNFFINSTFIQNGTPVISENAVLLETIVLSFTLSFVVGLVAADNWSVNASFFRMGTTKLYFDKFINTLSVWNLKLYYISFIIFDKGILEFFGPYGAVKSLAKVAKFVSINQPFLIYNYICFIGLGVLIIFFSTSIISEILG
jgi:hypothetical protein